MKTSSSEPNKPSKSILRLLISVIGAAIGVQKREIYEHDFQHGKPLVFIVAGIIFTLLLIIGLITLVHFILP